MKKLFLCIIASTALMGASAQKQLKTAQENNPFGYNEGKATYTYYESEDGTKVKDGSFHATGKSAQRNLVGTETSTSIDVKGTYKDGLMNGTWNYTAVVVDYGDNPCYSFTTKMSLNYNNGVPHGTWTYSVSTQKARDIILVSMFPYVYKWGPYKTVTDHTGSMTVTFENGIIRKIASSFPYEKLSGSFTKDGRPEGVWTFTYSGKSGKRTFKQGFDVSGNSDEENKLLSQYLNGTLSEEGLAEQGYGIKNRPMTDLYAYTFYYKFYECFYNDGFCRNFLTGDKSPSKDELFGSFDRLWRITYRTWDPLKGYSFQECKEEYEEDLRAFDISKEDKVRIREELQKVEREIELKPKKEELLNDMFDRIKECKDLIGRRRKDIREYKYSSDKSEIQYDSTKIIGVFIPKCLPYCTRDADHVVSNVIRNAKQKQELRSSEIQKLEANEYYLSKYNIDYCTYDDLVSTEQTVTKIIQSICDLNFMRDIEYVHRLGDIYHPNMNYARPSDPPTGVALFLDAALKYILCWTPFSDYELVYCIIDGASKMTGDKKELAKKYKSIKKQPEEIVRLLLSYNDNKGLDLFENFLTRTYRKEL